MVLLFPLVSTAIGWLRYDKAMEPVELTGALLIPASLPLGQIGMRRTS